MFAPAVWLRGFEAARKGHRVGAPVGDPWMMPGLFLVDDQVQIRWSWSFAHAGDHPDFTTLPQEWGYSKSMDQL